MFEALMLICDGVANAPSTSVTSAAIHGDGGTARGNATTTEMVRSSERFFVEVVDGVVRVRVPAPMVPGIRSAGSGGWWTLNETSITEDAISGRFRFNIFNKPVVTISRVTGDMDVRSNYYSFQGMCAPAPQGQRLF